MNPVATQSGTGRMSWTEPSQVCRWLRKTSSRNKFAAFIDGSCAARALSALGDYQFPFGIACVPIPPAPETFARSDAGSGVGVVGTEVCWEGAEGDAVCMLTPGCDEFVAKAAYKSHSTKGQLKQ